MLVAVQDEAGRLFNNDARDALHKLGGRNVHLEYRGSYAMIGYKGLRPNFFREKKSGRGRGPTEVSANVLIGN